MILNHKFKVLWCDRHIHVGNLKDLLSALTYLEVSTFEHPAEAIEAFKRDQSYRLIISGNLFSDGSDGLEFLKALSLISSSPQFLIFTGEAIPETDPFLILNNFTYFHKDDYTPEKFEALVKDLVTRSIEIENPNTRIAAIRKHYGLSVGQFASLLKVSPEIVGQYEEVESVPSSYVVAVCNKFEIPLNFFSCASIDVFLQLLRDRETTQNQRAKH